MHAPGDSLYLWANEEKIMTYINKVGKIIKQDTVLKSYTPPNGISAVSYKVGIGFYTNIDNTLLFYDRSGIDTLNWKPKPRGILNDFTRDPAGRWYITWSSGIVDVFSPNRTLLGSILAEGTGEIYFWNSALYMKRLPDNEIRRIIPGF